MLYAICYMYMYNNNANDTTNHRLPEGDPKRGIQTNITFR